MIYFLEELIVVQLISKSYIVPVYSFDTDRIENIVSVVSLLLCVDPPKITLVLHVDSSQRKRVSVSVEPF